MREWENFLSFVHTDKHAGVHGHDDCVHMADTLSEAAAIMAPCGPNGPPPADVRPVKYTFFFFQTKISLVCSRERMPSVSACSNAALRETNAVVGVPGLGSACFAVSIFGCCAEKAPQRHRNVQGIVKNDAPEVTPGTAQSSLWQRFRVVLPRRRSVRNRIPSVASRRPRLLSIGARSAIHRKHHNVFPADRAVATTHQHQPISNTTFP